MRKDGLPLFGRRQHHTVRFNSLCCTTSLQAIFTLILFLSFPSRFGWAVSSCVCVLGKRWFALSKCRHSSFDTLFFGTLWVFYATKCLTARDRVSCAQIGMNHSNGLPSTHSSPFYLFFFCKKKKTICDYSVRSLICMQVTTKTVTRTRPRPHIEFHPKENASVVGTKNRYSKSWLVVFPVYVLWMFYTIIRAYTI